MWKMTKNARLFSTIQLFLCVHIIAADYKLLKRQKRVSDDDYINLNQKKPLQLPQEDHLGKLTTNDEVFQALLRTPKVSLDDIKEQRVDKRYADKEKDPFEKLKDFFDYVEKRSVDDFDSSLQNEFISDKSDGERPFQLKSTLEAISIDETGSGSGSGQDNSTSESGESWVSGSGAVPLFGIQQFSFDKKIKIPQANERNYADHTNDYAALRISKREVMERFEGLPESLAINEVQLTRENPRVKILKREAGGKVFADIPLPFNKIYAEEPTDNVEVSDEEHTKVNEATNEYRGAADEVNDKYTTSIFSKLVPYREFKSMDVFKRELGEDIFKNLRIIDEQKAKSLFDDDEGHFLNNVKRDGIYYDSRSRKFLISAQIDNDKPFQTDDTRSPTFKASLTDASKNHTDVLNNSLIIHFALPNVSTSTVNCTTVNLLANNSCYIPKQVLNETLNNSTFIKPEHKKSETILTKRDVEELFTTLISVNPLIQSPIDRLSNKLVKVQKREILSDFDPNIAKEMGDTGKQLEDEFKVDNKRNLDKSEGINVLSTDPLVGIWSGLGTEPEFVHGLFKQDYVTGQNNTEISKNLDTSFKSEDGIQNFEQKKNKQLNFPSIFKRSLFSKSSSNQDAASPSNINKQPKKREVKNHKLLGGKKVNHTTQNLKKTENDKKKNMLRNTSKDKSSKENSNNYQKRDVVPQEDSDQEQYESKQMEMGSLGSLNMHVREKRGMSTNFNNDNDEEVNIRKKRRRSNEETSRVFNDSSINHATGPTVHGKVVFAFDEVKELMPTRRFFSKQESNLSPELLNTENSGTLSRSDISRPSEQDKSKDFTFQNTSPESVFESLPTSKYIPSPKKIFDPDRDLADSMVLGEKKNFFGAQPVKVEFTSNKNAHPLTQERSDVYKEPKILNENIKGKRLQKAQLAQLKASEIRSKYQQLINWQSGKPAEIPETEKDGVETEKEIQELGKQFEDTDIEKLQEAEVKASSLPLAYVNPKTSDSAYLARKLQEKHYDAESLDEKAKRFNQLQQKILHEQEQYKLLVQQQQKEYQDKLDNMAYYDSVYSNAGPYEVSPEVQPDDIQDMPLMTGDLSNTNKKFKSPLENPLNQMHASKPDINKQNQLFPKDSPYVLSFKNGGLKNSTLSSQSINSLHPQPKLFINEPLGNIEKEQEAPDLIKLILKEVNRAYLNKSIVNPLDFEKKRTSLKEDKANNPENVIESHSPQSFVKPSISVALNKNSTFSPISNMSVPKLNPTVQTTMLSLNDTNNNSSAISLQRKLEKTKTFTTTALPFIISTMATNSPNIKSPIVEKKLSNVTYLENFMESTINNTVSNIYNNISRKNETINMPTSKLFFVLSNSTNMTLASGKDAKSLPFTTAIPLPFPIDISYQPKRSYKALEIEQRVDGYVGCYMDHLEQGRDLPVRAGVPFVTPNNCRSACKKTGYRYAGLQYGYLCFCGNSYGKYDIAPDSECDTVCSGNETHTCGGLWRNKIYNTENVNEELNEGPVPVYITPREKYHLRDIHPRIRSDIPEKPIPFKSKVISSEAFNNEFDSNSSSQVLLSSEEVLKNSQEAEKQDIANLQNVNFLVNKNPSEHEGETLVNFSYLHQQKETEEEFQNSPPLPLKIEPGTHLFRGEVILKQSWYSDLANPNSTKYLILTGNIEQALKNLFAKDSMFLKAEVMSLREISHRMPRKTLVDFTLTFEESKRAEDVARVLFTTVQRTERLDDMPVLPATLKIKEYLFEPSVQAYIPQVIEGNFTEESSNDRQNNNVLDVNRNLNLLQTTYVSPVVTRLPDSLMSLPNPMLETKAFNKEVSKAFNRSLQVGQAPSSFTPDSNFNRLFNYNLQNMKQNIPSNLREVLQTTNSYLTRENLVPVNRAVTTRILPAKTSGASELSKYLESQSRTSIASPKVSIKNNPSNKKVPYVLRMFFWKDMLARKKREDHDDLHREKAKKAIRFSSALPVRERRSEEDQTNSVELANLKVVNDLNLAPETRPKPQIKIIREARSQADQWSTKYKRDVDKMMRRYDNNSLLKRTKRVVPRKELQDLITDKIEDNDDFSTLFQEKQATRTRRNVVKKALFSDDNPNVKRDINNFSNEIEKELHRNKRFKDER